MFRYFFETGTDIYHTLISLKNGMYDMNENILISFL